MNHYEPKMREMEAEPLFYRGMFADSTFPIHLTEVQIQEAERQMGGRFPDDYREFIRDFGGFSLDAIFPVQFDFQREMSCSAFLGITSKEGSKVWDVVRSYLSACKYSEVWNEEWLHLATTGGPSIALAFKGPNIGNVYTFDIDYSLGLVASSFDEFMNSLYREEDASYDAEATNFWDSFSTP